MNPVQLAGLFDSSVFGVPLVVFLVVGGIVALSAGALLRVQVVGIRRSGSQAAGGRRELDNPGSSRSTGFDKPGNEPVSDDEPSAREEPDETPELLRTASSRYSREEYDGTIQAAYMFTRVRLADEHGLSTDGTHWDFFKRYDDAGAGDEVAALRELTEVYEQAAFGSRESTRSEADRALALSGELTGVVPPDTV